jgi:uncharacterized DUF497 family protein
MPFYLFHWNEHNLAQNGVSPEEFEEVLCNPYREDVSRSSGRPIAFGYTAGQRYLACVYEMLDEMTVLPVTAYELEE